MSNKINTISFNIDIAPKAHDMGRNLLRGAALGSLDSITEGGITLYRINSLSESLVKIVDGVDGNKGVWVKTNAGETNVYRGVFFIAAVNKGEQYTLSAWVKGTAGTTLYLEVLNSTGTERKNSDGTDCTRYVGSGSFTALTADWKKVSFTFKVDDKNAGYLECNFYTNQPGDFTLCEPKLERGDTATAFCLNEADLAAAVYDIVLDSSFQATYAVDTEDPNTIDLSVSGGFSVYSAIDGLRKLYDGNDLHYELFVGGNVVELQTNTITNGKGTLGYQKNNLSPDSAAATAMLVIYRGTDTSNVVATKNITISMHPHVLFDDSNGLLVKINNNKKSITTIKSDGDSLSATVKDIGDGLAATGIDIKKNTIDLRAGQVSFLGANGNPYITAELDDEGMPHLIFYNKAGTAMYDLGYTGLFNLIQDSDKQSWVNYTGQIIDGDTAQCASLTGGNYRLVDNDIVSPSVLERTVYEYHPASIQTNGKKTYYNSECKNQLYLSTDVDESLNNKPTGEPLYTDNGTLQLNGYLYELVERKVVSKTVQNGTTTIEEHFRFSAHTIIRNRLNLSDGMSDYNDSKTVKIKKLGTAISGSIETKYQVSIDGSDYEDKDIIKLSL